MYVQGCVLCVCVCVCVCGHALRICTCTLKRAVAPDEALLSRVGIASTYFVKKSLIVRDPSLAVGERGPMKLIPIMYQGDCTLMGCSSGLPEVSLRFIR